MPNEDQAADKDPDDLSASKVLLDFYKDEGARMHQRTDWFLIFHAILLEAFLSEQSKCWVQMVVGSIGVFMSYLWLMTGVRHSWLFMHLGECMVSEHNPSQTISSILKRIFDVRNKEMPRSVYWARPTSCFNVITPGMFFLAWMALLALVEFRWKWHCLLAALGTCIVGSLIACCLGPGPRIKPELVTSVFPKPKGDSQGHVG